MKMLWEIEIGIYRPLEIDKLKDFDFNYLNKPIVGGFFLFIEECFKSMET